MRRKNFIVSIVDKVSAVIEWFKQKSTGQTSEEKELGFIHNKKQNRLPALFLVCVLSFLGIAVLMIFICLAFQNLLRAGGASGSENAAMKVAPFSDAYWAFTGLGSGIFILWVLIQYRINSFNEVRGSADLEDSHWLDKKEVLKAREFHVCTWEKINEEEDGIVIQASANGKKIPTLCQIDMSDFSHTIQEELVNELLNGGATYTDIIEKKVTLKNRSAVTTSTPLSSVAGSPPETTVEEKKSNPPENKKQKPTIEKNGREVASDVELVEFEIFDESEDELGDGRNETFADNIEKDHTELDEQHHIMDSSSSMVVLEDGNSYLNITPVETEMISREEYETHTFFEEQKHEENLRKKAIESLKASSSDYPSLPKTSSNLDIMMLNNNVLHTVVVGTTGVGKTTGFLNQNIEINAHSKTKPSMVFTDPKGELFAVHSKNLRACGYRVAVIDLEHPYHSTCWNPLEICVKRIRILKLNKAFNGNPIPASTYRPGDSGYLVFTGKFKNLDEAKDFVKISRDEILIQNKKIPKKDDPSNWEEVKYFYTAKHFLTASSAASFLLETEDELFRNAQEFVDTVCPIKNKEQQNWELGARSLIQAYVYALCEDAIDGLIDESTITLYNIYMNLTQYCTEECTELKNYLINHRREYNPQSRVPSLANMVLVTTDRTLTSYLSEVGLYMKMFADRGVQAFTIKNEIELDTLDETPTAFFIIVPDAQKVRHPLASLLLTQIYRELVYKAGLNAKMSGGKSDATLKRKVYFWLEEFGNIPKIEELDTWVTVARSRGIRFIFILQAFTQMVQIYGREMTDTILGSCNIKIFLGTSDQNTRKEFSDYCGQRKAVQNSINSSVDTNASSNASLSGQPLVSPSELMRLNGTIKGYALIVVTGFGPILNKFTASYDDAVKALYNPMQLNAVRGSMKLNKFDAKMQAEKHSDLKDTDKLLATKIAGKNKGDVSEFMEATPIITSSDTSTGPTSDDVAKSDTPPKQTENPSLSDPSVSSSASPMNSMNTQIKNRGDELKKASYNAVKKGVAYIKNSIKIFYADKDPEWINSLLDVIDSLDRINIVLNDIDRTQALNCFIGWFEPEVGDIWFDIYACAASLFDDYKDFEDFTLSIKKDQEYTKLYTSISNLYTACTKFMSDFGDEYSL